MTSDNGTNSLLLFRVGPVFCCAPSAAIHSIIPPPSLTRPPGCDAARPGIFKNNGLIVSSFDLRYKFGLDKQDWHPIGRVIITGLKAGCVGFWVDEICEVMQSPRSGWGALPSLLPKGIFTQTLLLNDKIYLYADFENLYRIPTSGYLRGYINHLIEQQRERLLQEKSNAHYKTATTVAVFANSSAAPAVSYPGTQIQPSMQNAMEVRKVGAKGTMRPHKQQSPLLQTSETHSSSTAGTSTPSKSSDKVGLNITHPLNQITSPTQRTVAIKHPKQQTSMRHPSVHQSSASTDKQVTSANQDHLGMTPTGDITTEVMPNKDTAKENISSVTVPTNKTERNVVNNRASIKSQLTHSNTNSSNKTEPASGAFGIVILFLLVLIIVPGAVWYFSSTATDNPNKHLVVSKADNHVLTINTETTPNPQQIDMPDHAPLPKDQSSQPTVNSSVADTKNDSLPSVREHPETTKPATVSDTHSDDAAQSVPHQRPETTPTDVAIVDPQTEFRADIKSDESGITIILDAPEETSVFKQQNPTEDKAALVPATQTGAEQDRANDNDRTAANPTTELKTSALPKMNTERQHATSDDLRHSSQEIMHIVVKGDTLWHIALRYVNNPYKYPELARLSNIKNPNLIYPGNRVRIIKRSRHAYKNRRK